MNNQSSNYNNNFVNTEISCKPTPLGVGQLFCNCPEISGLETTNKPRTLVRGKTQVVSDLNNN